MKHFILILVAITLSACATTSEGMMPRTTDEASTPWGYEDMCNDPERRSPIHCEESEDNGN